MDSNSIMLAARAAQAGARTFATQVQPDDPVLSEAAARCAAQSADLVLILAGSSTGRDDYTALILSRIGAQTVHGVAIGPGHPVRLGHAVMSTDAGPISAGADPGRTCRSAVPVIGAPGYPLAAAVFFELFALPVLNELQGRPLASQGEARLAVLDSSWTSAPDVEEWIPVTPAPAAPARLPVATPCRGRGAGALRRLVRADAWRRHPMGCGEVRGGDLIEVFPIATTLDEQAA